MASQESRLVISIDARNAEKTAKELNRELQNMTTSGNAADRQVGVLGSSLKTLAGYMAGIVTVSTAINRVDTYTGLQNRLKLVTDSQQELNMAMRDTFAIAQKTASTWDSTAMVYQRFADNADRLGITMKTTAELTETVSKAISVSGGSAASAEAALVQFGQALASGVLRGEEFNSIAEQAPALLKAIAQGLGVNIGQLRSMAAEGEITGDVLVKALTDAKPYIDDLFNKTDFTISQSFTKLSNEVTKFVGEAGKGSGAASALSDSIGFLAKNLSTIADIAIVGGVAMLTKTILAQTVAIQGSITASVARRAADTAVLQSQVQLAALEVQRTRQIAAQAISEIGLARQELNSATTRTARAAATMRLTQAEIAHSIALKQSAAAVATQTVAENALNASRSRGAMLLGLVGGPIGAITIGVAALTAGYMYLQKRTAEANAKLEEQGRVAEKTKEELLALKGVQLDVAKDDLTASFEDQNDKLNKLNLSFNGFIRTVKNANAGNKEVYEISDQVHKGLMSQADAVERLNKLKLLTPEQKSQGLDLIKSYEEARVKAQQNADAQKTLGQQVTLSGNAASNAVGKVNDNTNAMYNNADAANAAADAQSKYISNLQKGAAQTIMTNKLIAKGWEIERAKMASQAAFENGGKVSAKDIQIIDMNIAANKKLQASEDAIANAKRGSAKATSAALTQHRKDAKEANRVDEEQRNLREQYIYAYADREKQIELNLAKEITEIQKANFANSSQTQGFIDNAKQRADLEKRLYSAQLSAELNEWQDTEQQKLDRKVEINSLLIQLDRDMNDDLKQQALASLQDRSNFEYNEIELAKERRIFAANEAMMTEIDAMKERYRLEYAEINNITDEQEKAALKQALARSAIRGGTPAGGQMLNTVSDVEVYKSQTQRLQEEMKKRTEIMEAAYTAAKVAAVGNNEEMLRIEGEYLTARTELQAEFDRKAAQTRKQEFLGNFETTAGMFDSLSSSFSSLTETIKQQSGAQSEEYRKMFEFQKQFAIVSAVINGGLAVSQVWADPALNFYAKIAASIATGVATAANVAMISSQQPQGFKSGGYTGNVGVNQEAGVVHGQEFVLNAEATRRVGVGTLEAINSGKSFGVQTAQAQGDVNLNNINLLDPSLFDSYMQTQAGTKTFINTIANNKSKINSALGR